jgi:hypothetical protein
MFVLGPPPAAVVVVPADPSYPSSAAECRQLNELPEGIARCNDAVLSLGGAGRLEEDEAALKFAENGTESVKMAFNPETNGTHDLPAAIWACPVA